MTRNSFNIKEINNGWLISFYNDVGEQCFFVSSVEDMISIITNVCKQQGLQSPDDSVTNNYKRIERIGK
jgi:hypothetical protein